MLDSNLFLPACIIIFAGKLIDFLSSWESQGTAETIPERMEQLWVALYERNYIELDDVYGLQSWLQALIDIGYEFATLRQRRQIHNVVLMGQFNFASKHTVKEAVFWTQKWRRWFRNVVVAGPFDRPAIELLQQHKIEALAGADDEGWVSPMQNFARTLKNYANNSNIDGVLYLHDDALLNMGPFLNQPLLEGTDDVIVTHVGRLQSLWYKMTMNSSSSS